MTLSTFLGFFWKGFNALPARRPSLPRKDSPDIATMEAHYERARRALEDSSDLAALEARMKLLEAERSWW